VRAAAVGVAADHPRPAAVGLGQEEAVADEGRAAVEVADEAVAGQPARDADPADRLAGQAVQRIAIGPGAVIPRQGGEAGAVARIAAVPDLLQALRDVALGAVQTLAGRGEVGVRRHDHAIAGNTRLEVEHERPRRRQAGIDRQGIGPQHRHRCFGQRPRPHLDRASE
jgi:hypothetical protein